MTEREASAQAKRTGKPVVADALTTETAQTTANPDGTLTLTQSAVPVRTFRDGAWRGLDATLKANPDGTLSPAVTPSSVVLSGGGSGPMASLHTGGQGFELTLPVALPKPVLDGNSALYPEVLPGVDLTVTVRETGAISDVLTVKDKRAAHDPRLKDLLNARTDTTAGLKAEADADGNLAVTDQHGRKLYTAPAPLAWDSTPTAEADRPAAAGNRAAVRPESAALAAAHRAKLKPTVKDRSIELAAPADLLDAADTTYPVFLDPTYSPNWGKSAYSSPSAAYPGTKYWNSTVDPTSGITQIGNGGYGGEALSIFNFPIDQNLLHGAVVYGAYFGITETHSWACLTSGHNQSVGVYVPGATLDSTNATWNYWSGNLGSRVGDQNFAKGYNSNCPAGPINAYDITGPINQAVNDWKWTQTVALRADDHSDNYAFKEFQASTANLTITYDKKPDTPSGLYTSPATNCSSTVLGDTSVTLYAPVSTPTGSSLTTGFTLYKSGDGSHTNLLTPANGINSASYNGASGQPAVMPVPESLFKTASGGASTSFTWQAVTTDNTLTSDWSSPCTFTWDPTRPGAPGVVSSGGTVCPQASESGTLPQVGTLCTFTLTPPVGSTVSGYQYQLNQNPPVKISATGLQAITVPLEHLVNTLTVNAYSAGGNLGQAVTVWFTGSAINPPAKDGDLNLDGTPDLIVPGSPGSAFPAGLWLSSGHGDGTVAPSTTNIGVNGLGINPTADPTEWNGAQTVTGNFCGNGAQDVLAYFPTGANAGGGTVMCSDGSTDPLRTTLGSATAPLRITGGSLFGTDRSPATQVVTAGNTSSRSTGHPDLLAVTGGDLVLHWSTTSNGYGNTDPDWGSICLANCTVLTALNTPDGTRDWDQWKLATAQLAGGTALYLWKPATGALHLWTGLKATTDGTTLTTTGTYTIAASGWNTGKNLTLRAADLTGSGIPTLWTTDHTTGQTTNTKPTTLANTPTLTNTTTTLTTPNHSWNFQDIGTNPTGSTLTTTTDSAGSLALTGTAGAQWNTGDLYGSDVLLNTAADGSTPSTAHGGLTAGGPALTLSNTGDLTVSARVKPNNTGGIVFSQDGTTTAGLMLYPDAGTNLWSFCMATGDSTGWPYDCIHGGAVELGLWAQVTATYQASTGMMTLYVNGVQTGVLRHVPAGGFTGPARLGSYLNGQAQTAWFSGQIDDVRTWNAAVPPVQAQTAGGTYVSVSPTRLVDTRSGLGGVTGPVAGTHTVPVQITGKAGVPTSKVSAAVVSVTATGAAGPGFLTLYPDGTPLPVSSTLNYTTGTVTNSAVVPVGGNGKINVTVSNGASVQIIVDVTGYFTTDTSATGAARYVPFTPTRVIDTRIGTGVPTGKIAAGGTLVYPTAGGAGGRIPSSGVSAVALAMTVVNSDANGFVTANADGVSAVGAVTSLSYTVSVPTTVLQIVPVAANGKLDIQNNYGGSIDVVGDVVGYFTTTPSAGTGQYYHPMASTRLVDTRLSGGIFTSGEVRSYGRSTPISAVNPTYVLNLTATGETGSGFIAVDTAGANPPATTSLSYATGTDQAAFDLAGTSGGTFKVAGNGTSTHLVIDANGYFAGY
ncbi:LamG domain-containing protein [Kitasatospora cineracea]|uniref:LamG domain-containing protein n=1 Tax=Kitasatospora cineracea TaxID=88074 RepID=UPI000F48C8B4|nr:LamG domain-containing protein [Kitasatospora cineracea]